MASDEQANGQCGWCLQRERQAFALICPEHISEWRNSLDEMQRGIQVLCRAVGEFDGARPESPQMVLEICTQRVERLTAELAAAQAREQALRRVARVSQGIIHEGLHGGRATDPEHQEMCEMPACRNIRAALAGGQGEG